MKLEEKEFWAAVEDFKNKDDSGAQLELWLAHGLPIYSNGDQLLRLYEKKQDEEGRW